MGNKVRVTESNVSELVETVYKEMYGCGLPTEFKIIKESKKQPSKVKVVKITENELKNMVVDIAEKIKKTQE